MELLRRVVLVQVAENTVGDGIADCNGGHFQRTGNIHKDRIEWARRHRDARGSMESSVCKSKSVCCGSGRKQAECLVLRSEDTRGRLLCRSERVSSDPSIPGVHVARVTHFHFWKIDTWRLDWATYDDSLSPWNLDSLKFPKGGVDGPTCLLTFCCCLLWYPIYVDVIWFVSHVLQLLSSTRFTQQNMCRIS